MLRLFLIFWNSLTIFEKETRFLPTTDPSLFDSQVRGNKDIFKGGPVCGKSLLVDLLRD